MMLLILMIQNLLTLIISMATTKINNGFYFTWFNKNIIPEIYKYLKK